MSWGTFTHTMWPDFLNSFPKSNLRLYIQLWERMMSKKHTNYIALFSAENSEYSSSNSSSDHVIAVRFTRWFLIQQGSNFPCGSLGTSLIHLCPVELCSSAQLKICSHSEVTVLPSPSSSSQGISQDQGALSREWCPWDTASAHHCPLPQTPNEMDKEDWGR